MRYHCTSIFDLDVCWEICSVTYNPSVAVTFGGKSARDGSRNRYLELYHDSEDAIQYEI